MTTPTPNPVSDETTQRAARALIRAIDAAWHTDPAGLEPASDAIDTADDIDAPRYGMLAVLDGAVVRITVEPARPEEAAAVLGGEL